MSIPLSINTGNKLQTRKDIMQSIPYPNDTSNISHFYKEYKI